MNLPNKLTVLRMLMIPLFLLFFFAEFIPMHYLWALVVFALASLTDMLDGQIARKYNLITDFGKLMDPLADKLLVTAALCCMLPWFGVIGTISLILILSREFLVTSIRLIAAGKGKVLAADIWGKVKTVLQMSWIIFYLLLLALEIRIIPYVTSYPTVFEPVVDVLFVLNYALFAGMVLMTVLSGVHYVLKNRGLFSGA